MRSKKDVGRSTKLQVTLPHDTVDRLYASGVLTAARNSRAMIEDLERIAVLSLLQVVRRTEEAIMTAHEANDVARSVTSESIEIDSERYREMWRDA